MTPTNVVVDVERRRVFVDGKPGPKLALKEFEIFVFLARNEERVSTREEIYQAVWGVSLKESGVDSRTIDQHIARTRRKFGKIGAEILPSSHGVGYHTVGVRFDEIAPAPPKIPAFDVKRFLRAAAEQLKAGQTITITVA